MQNNTNIVCRFCLKIVDSVNVDIPNDVMRDMLSLLLIKLDLDASEHPLICGICSEVLNEIYFFKSKCLYAEDIINTQIETNLKVSLREILIETENKCNVNIGQDEVVCRLCIKIPLNDSYIALAETGEKISFCRDMIQILQIHLPEMDLSITKKPIICEECHVRLKNYISFARNCMAAEEKIKLYCDSQKISGPVDLACVLQFMENKAFDLQDRPTKDLAIKQENSVMVKVEKVQDADDYISDDHFVEDGSSSELYLKNEEIEIKSENDMSEEIDDSAPSEACNNFSKSSSLKRKKQIRKSAPKGRQCQNCEYETRYKSKMIKHTAKHRDPRPKRIFKCDKCPYETVYKYHLRTHNLKHMDKSEVEMHKCDNCKYETKQKCHLIRHMMKHYPTAQRKFKCDKCPYETVFKYSLRTHNVIHNDNSEVEIYTCDSCKYETRQKRNLIRHMMKHYPRAERKFKCDKCPYGTHLKSSLLTHNLIHKDKSEVETYKCENCEFETKYKSSMIQHMVTHRDPRAEKKFKCGQCTYKTDFKASLHSHHLRHMDKSEVEMFKCENCRYETKYKSDMHRHMRKHLDSKEERKFESE